jgi:quercetin dioxygenase-like cupin family protein
MLVPKAWATSSLGLAAQTLAFGVAENGIGEHMQITRNPDGTVTPWLLQLQALRETDYHLLHLVLSPGGHSGWHSHPGLLVGVVKSGQIDFYDANCQKQTVAAGEVYTENDAVHAIINNGSVDADLYITFLVKHDAPRRRDEPAPACAVDTGIP